jgi:sugar-specific transcriptional regulator TrmB
VSVTPEDSLSALGFTELEARLYCELLRRSPATGYRLSKDLGKAAANIYQGLAALMQKGAVMADEGTARAFRPVPPDELLSSLGKGFERRRSEAAAALARIEQPAGDDRVYEIRSVAQILERAEAMIARAGDIILFDLFPAPLAMLRAPLEDAARRGVAVAGLVYEPVAPAPAFTAVSAASAAGFLDRWPGEQLSLICDAQEHLVALIARGGERVLHGIWSGSAYLSALQHNGLASEIRLLAASPAEDDPLARIGLLRAYPAGLRSLVGARAGAEALEPNG